MSEYLLINQPIFDITNNPYDITKVETVFNPYEAQRIQTLLMLMAESEKRKKEEDKKKEKEKSDMKKKVEDEWKEFKPRLLRYILVITNISKVLGIEEEEIKKLEKTHNDISADDTIDMTLEQMEQLKDKFLTSLNRDIEFYTKIADNRL